MNEIKFSVPMLAKHRSAEFEAVMASKTKPTRSLGVIEDVALRLCLIQDSVRPQITEPTIVVFAADHGIAAEGVSAYPQSVTAAMVQNFLGGGAAINVLARQSQADLVVVNAGVKTAMSNHPQLINTPVGPGTKNFLHGPAMSTDQLDTAMLRGRDVVDQIWQRGCNTIGFGEMGIGNSSSAAVLMSLICNMPLTTCVGPGTGLGDEGVRHKIAKLELAMARAPRLESAQEIMAYFGGFELAMMTGAMLRAGELGMTQLVDGFCATAALLVAVALEPNLKDYCFYSHQSAEPGHAAALRHLQAEALLRFSMRLGEGTGCAMALPMLRMAAAIMCDMATFDEAQIAQKLKGEQI